MAEKKKLDPSPLDPVQYVAGCELLKNPEWNTSGAIQVFSQIREHVEKSSYWSRRESEREFIFSLVARGALMAQRMIIKLREYDPSWKDHEQGFDEGSLFTDGRPLDLTTVCSVIRQINFTANRSQREEDQSDPTLQRLCAYAISCTKQYNRDLVAHRQKLNNWS